MDNSTRRQLLDRARSAGFPGSILDVYTAYDQGRDLIQEFVQQQQIASGQPPMQIAQTPQEQEQGLRPAHQAGNVDQSMAFPNVQPGQSFNTVGMKVPINIDKIDNQGNLVESYKAVPPGIQNLPTGPYEGTVIESPAKMQTGGTKTPPANLPWLGTKGQVLTEEEQEEKLLDKKFGIGPTVDKAKAIKDKEIIQKTKRIETPLPSGAITPTMGPVEIALMAPVAGASALRAAPILGSALNTSIAGVPGLTVGNALGAGFASDALVNRLPQVPGQLSRGEYTNAAINAGTGVLDLLGANMLSPLYKGAKTAAQEAGKFITTQTPVKNTYKLNPAALKENPEMYLYRARPVGQDVNLNMAAQLKAKEAAGEKLSWWQKNLLNPQTSPQLAAREKYFGQWFEKDPKRLDFYINKETRNFADEDEIELLRTQLPKSEADKLNVSKFEDAKNLSASPETEFILPKEMVESAERFPETSWKQLIAEDKAFNTPHWWKGFGSKKTPSELEAIKNLLKKNVTHIKQTRPLTESPPWPNRFLHLTDDAYVIGDMERGRTMVPDPDAYLPGRLPKETPKRMNLTREELLALWGTKKKQMGGSYQTNQEISMYEWRTGRPEESRKRYIKGGLKNRVLYNKAKYKR